MDNILKFPETWRTEGTPAERFPIRRNDFDRTRGYFLRLNYAAHFGITPETATPSQRAYYGI